MAAYYLNVTPYFGTGIKMVYCPVTFEDSGNILSRHRVEVVCLFWFYHRTSLIGTNLCSLAVSFQRKVSESCPFQAEFKR